MVVQIEQPTLQRQPGLDFDARLTVPHVRENFEFASNRHPVRVTDLGSRLKHLRTQRKKLAQAAAHERVARGVGQRMDGGHPIVAGEGNRSLFYRFSKRLIDVAGSVALLVVLSPLLLLTLLVLMVTTRGRPIFVQTRIGHRGRRFPMLKFRTMHLNADKIQAAVQNEKDGPIFKNRRDPRITRIGRILRKTSIDEMPQLLNVLAGHMSLVGPRPPVEKEVRKYEPWQHRRLAVKPGITCLWQVSGRSEIGFQDWVRMDLWYLNHQSLRTDLQLLLKTPLSVISCRGAY